MEGCCTYLHADQMNQYTMMNQSRFEEVVIIIWY